MTGAVGSDRGSGSVLMVALIAAVVAVAVLLAPVGIVAVARHRAAGAADSAALAAADTALGFAPGIPCETAGRVADRNAAALASCVQRDAVVHVVVRVAIGPFAVEASAAAGPPCAASGGTACTGR